MILIPVFLSIAIFGASVSAIESRAPTIPDGDYAILWGGNLAKLSKNGSSLASACSLGPEMVAEGFGCALYADPRSRQFPPELKSYRHLKKEDCPINCSPQNFCCPTPQTWRVENLGGDIIAIRPSARGYGQFRLAYGYGSDNFLSPQTGQVNFAQKPVMAGRARWPRGAETLMGKDFNSLPGFDSRWLVKKSEAKPGMVHLLAVGNFIQPFETQRVFYAPYWVGGGGSGSLNRLLNHRESTEYAVEELSWVFANVSKVVEAGALPPTKKYCNSSQTDGPFSPGVNKRPPTACVQCPFGSVRTYLTQI